MRGVETEQSPMFSYVSAEARVPQDHPLRPIRKMTDEALRSPSRRFERIYSPTGPPSVPPEQLLRARRLQVLYSVRREQVLMEQLDYNLLFPWFVSLEIDDRVWYVTVFTKNRDRRLRGDVAEAFFDAVLAQAERRKLLSDEHFTVDGTLVEAWAGHKILRPKEGSRGGKGSEGGARSGISRGAAD
jgi:transposase